MPIRFRCAYCNQLMGISRRKVGTVVRCPKCSGQVVVPNAAPDDVEESMTSPEHAAVKALEDPAMEALLAGAAREAAGLSKPKRKAPKPIAEVDVEAIDSPFNELPESAPTAPTAPSPARPPTSWAKTPVTIIAPRWVVYAAAVAAVVVLGLTFLLGNMMGK